MSNETDNVDLFYINSIFATDFITDSHHQKVKMTIGADGVDDGPVSSSNPMPVDLKGSGETSSLNTTTTPLSSGSTYTGTWEQNDHPDVLVSCKTDNGGTLYFDFSNDGANADTFPTNGFTVTAGIHEFHVAVKGPRYFRVRLVNDIGAQSYLRLYTYYGSWEQGIAPINFSIADDADAKVVKSVISGIGNTTATVTDHKALQVTFPAEGKTAFGELLTGQLSPVIQVQYPYNLNSTIVTQQNNQSGSASVVSSMAQLSTGAAANSSSTLLSNDSIFYEPGLGVRARFTGMFTTGVANSEQIIGIGDAGEGFFFGYNGTSFGILRRRGGSPEIRTLTVSTASSTAENITITLDGTADATVAVTNSGNTTTTANEIAAHDYSDVGRGWTAKAVGSTVVFTSRDDSSRTGTYSLSGASTAVGTFAQTLAGAAPTDSWVAQASWNGDDIFDGNGLTGVTIDPTKLNVFQIDFQYLGAGLIRFYIEDSDDGELHLVHAIEYSNNFTVPSIDNPTMGMFMRVENTSNTSDLTLSSASFGAFTDGAKFNIGPKIGIEGQKNLSGTSAETPIVSFRVKEVFHGKQNRSKIKINYIAASVEHTKPCFINFYGNATLTGASFSDIDSNTSPIQKDTSATAATGGTFFFGIPLGKTGQVLMDLKDDLSMGEFGPGTVITATIAPNSGNGAEGNVAFNLTEKL